MLEALAVGAPRALCQLGGPQRARQQRAAALGARVPAARLPRPRAGTGDVAGPAHHRTPAAAVQPAVFRRRASSSRTRGNGGPRTMASARPRRGVACLLRSNGAAALTLETLVASCATRCATSSAGGWRRVLGPRAAAEDEEAFAIGWAGPGIPTRARAALPTPRATPNAAESLARRVEALAAGRAAADRGARRAAAGAIDGATWARCSLRWRDVMVGPPASSRPRCRCASNTRTLLLEDWLDGLAHRTARNAVWSELLPNRDPVRQDARRRRRGPTS